MQLFFQKQARRFLSLAILFFFALPIGLSISGCKKVLPTTYCNGGDSGPVVGQVATITLSPSLATYGESLNYGQIGQSLSASAQDCKGNTVSVSSYTFASTNLQIADINPNTGQTCAGVWNRFTGGGVPDFTTCNPFTTPPPSYVAYVTATGGGAVSNAVPVFVHPEATAVVLGTATPTASCAAALASPTGDPSTNCCPLAYTAPTPAPPYTPGTCLSQTKTAQLSARVYSSGDTLPIHNITCQVGHVQFSAQGGGNIASIDENGVITANQPGSATITATISQSGSGSTAGFLSTCPPASIALTPVGQTGSNITVSLNSAQSFTTSVLDTNNNPITGLALTYNSTTTQTAPTSGSSVTPIFPGTATITAVCNPGTCNPAPFSQIGYLGNGVPLTSNGITVTATGTSSTVLFAGSTNSQYLYPLDTTTNQLNGLIKLPYTPNSMVMNPTGTTIYLGSSSALMTVNATNNSVTSSNTLIVGIVLAVSPDGNTLVTTDPVKKTVSIVSSSGGVEATNNGTGTRAQFSPDSQTVYITGTDQSGNPQLLVHNTYTSWQAIPLTANYTDVTVTVPHIGAYFAGSTFYEGRSYCPTTTLNNSVFPPVATNVFYPIADTTATPVDRLTATTDGNHILAAKAGTTSTLEDIAVTLPTTAECPKPGTTPIASGYFKSTPVAHTLTGINATAIDGVVATTNSEASFVTYTGTSTNPTGQLPFYQPAIGGNGSLSFIKLSGAATAPISGIFSSDSITFFVGTAGDNAIHLVTLTYPSSGPITAAETSVVTPNLPAATGTGIAQPNLLVQRPKKSTT